MNILLLSNGAPNYHHFFNRLAQNFQADGANVVVAVDSEFSRDINCLDTLGFDVYEFSSYFSKHQTNIKLLEKYANYNLNSALLSDYERAEVYGIWGTKDNEYFERLKSALLSYFENIFQHHSINTVLYENVSNTFAHFAFFVAEKHGARYCGIGGSRLPGRFSITADPLNDSEPAEIFHAIRTGERVVDPEVRAWCEEYLANIETTVPDYMKINGLDNTSLLKRYIRSDRIKTIITLLRHVRDDSTHAFQVGNPIRHYFNLFKRNVARKIKIKQLHKFYEPPKESEKFFLYPLHFHPESSTSILAGTYLNEYEVIRNIAFNLPQGIKLYVKDHISAYGFPPISFYNKLKKLPNVQIIHPSAQAKVLIKQSLGVITLTSTMGYEALLLEKKVFLYGTVFYEFHKDVIKIKESCNIFKILKDNISKEYTANREYNLDFVCAYYLSTKSGKLNLILKSSAAAQIADSIYKELKTSST
jgi:Capsule polysaccharide biosynthesis protein